MAAFRFDRFVLDPDDRQLLCDGVPLEVNSRYLDALILLVSQPGRLVSKAQFLDQVWRGVPVTDEALTQGIKTLRRQLGDDAAHPRFIETVHKHGYRFIAPVSCDVAAATGPSRQQPRSPSWPLALAGTLGGGAAGLVGGLFYGFVSTARPPGEGAISVLLVMVCLTVVTALIGAAGVVLGINAARALVGRSTAWDILGGALGGLAIGAVVKLVGVDSLSLLFGHAPRGLTGGAEGLTLGGAVGFGAWLAHRWANRSGVALAGLAGAVAGLTIVVLGGRLMGGSLALLSADFPGSRLSLAGIGELLGEGAFGARSTAVTGTLEGLLFGTGIVVAMLLAERRAKR